MEKIRIGVSTCLLGEAVKKDLTDTIYMGFVEIGPYNRYLFL